MTARHCADPPDSGLIAFLEAEGAREMRHAAGRSLLDHLVETHAIARRWGQPDWLARAALLHSIYGTDEYKQQLTGLSRRDQVAELAGPQAERIAYLFSVVPRGPLLAGTYRWAPVSADGALERAPTRGELDALVLLHMANLAEQARAQDGSPGDWLVRIRRLAELVIDSQTVPLPLFVATLAGFSQEREALTRRAYRAGVGSPDPVQRRADRLALAASLCPVIGEPCAWLAYLSRRAGDVDAARRWALCGRERLLGLGVAWDKRLRFEQWCELADALAAPRPRKNPSATSLAGHPGALYEAVAGGALPRLTRTARRSRGKPLRAPDPDSGRKRFHRYVETLAEADGSALGGIYPNLPSTPWLDPGDFPLVTYLESNFPAIREEILALKPSRFHRESERIQRSGDWDVAFLYERGRRRDDVCEACPVTTRGIEGYGAIRTMIGLSYVSRMRAGTHIGAHRGPTNLRVRCHLGIRVPEGDCAIRVGDETRRWEEGKCVVFDDHFEHEAWNHTAQDRIVVIADLWHPGLSSAEVGLLEGLHTYTSSHARRLTRYWAANAAARKAP